MQIELGAENELTQKSLKYLNLQKDRLGFCGQLHFFVRPLLYSLTCQRHICHPLNAQLQKEDYLLFALLSAESA